MIGQFHPRRVRVRHSPVEHTRLQPEPGAERRVLRLVPRGRCAEAVLDLHTEFLTHPQRITLHVLLKVTDAHVGNNSIPVAETIEIDPLVRSLLWEHELILIARNG